MCLNSFRNRNIVLLLIQTWLVGIVYYGGSELPYFIPYNSIEAYQDVQSTSLLFTFKTFAITPRLHPLPCFFAW